MVVAPRLDTLRDQGEMRLAQTGLGSALPPPRGERALRSWILGVPRSSWSRSIPGAGRGRCLLAAAARPVGTAPSPDCESMRGRPVLRLNSLLLLPTSHFALLGSWIVVPEIALRGEKKTDMSRDVQCV